MSVNNNLRAIETYFDNKKDQVLSLDDKGNLISKNRTDTSETGSIQVPYAFSSKEAFKVTIEVDSSVDVEKIETLVRKTIFDPKLEKTTATKVIMQLQKAHTDDSSPPSVAEPANTAGRIFGRVVRGEETKPLDSAYASADDTLSITSEKEFNESILNFIKLKTPDDLLGLYDLYKQSESLSKTLKAIQFPKTKKMEKNEELFTISKESIANLFGSHLLAIANFMKSLKPPFENKVFSFLKNGEINAKEKSFFSSKPVFVEATADGKGIYCDSPQTAAIMNRLINNLDIKDHQTLSEKDFQAIKDPVARGKYRLGEGLQQVSVSQKK